jgi:hypothetical protein
VNVETARAEVLDAYEGDHFRGNEASAGQHRTIWQPALGGSNALLLDSNASGSASTRLPIYADTDSVWFTLNASWTGSACARDGTLYNSATFRFGRTSLEVLHDLHHEATFTT